MGIPQIIVIVLYCVSVGVSLANHGKKIDASYSFWVKLFSTAIMIALLTWGGFFK